MKKLLTYLAFAGLTLGSGMFVSCDDDDKSDPELPVTDLSLSPWNFSAGAHEDICIGEIRTKDDNPEIFAGSTSEDIGITYYRLPQKDNGVNVYKILASVAERTVPASISSVVEVEVVGKTDERIYKKVVVGQYGLVSGVDNNTLAGVFNLVEKRELDLDDGDLDTETAGIAANLSFLADGTLTITNVKDADDFSNGQYNYRIDGNKLIIGNTTYTIANYSDDGQKKTLILESVEYNGSVADEYNQYVFVKAD